MVVLTGKFRYYKEENMAEFYKAAGLGFLFRQAAKSLTFEVEFIRSEIDKDDWSLQISCILKTLQLRFKLGVPFDFETSAGQKCQTTMTLVGGNTFVQSSTMNGTEVEKITRTIDGDQMRITCETKGTVGVLYLKRVSP